MVNGKRDVKARVVDKGYRRPDLREGSADAPGCVSFRPYHLQAAPMSALKGWRPRSREIRNTAPQAANLNREVYLRAPPERNLRGPERNLRGAGTRDDGCAGGTF